MVSQTKEILEHLKKGKSITPIEALKLYGCFRLSARIWDIRNLLNLEIDAETVYKKDKNGKAIKHYASYKLKETELIKLNKQQKK